MREKGEYEEKNREIMKKEEEKLCVIFFLWSHNLPCKNKIYKEET